MNKIKLKHMDNEFINNHTEKLSTFNLVYGINETGKTATSNHHLNNKKDNGMVFNNNDEKNRITDVQLKEGSIIISLFIKLTKETLVCILENAIRKSMKDFFRFLSRDEVKALPYENKFSTFINRKIKKFKQKYNIVTIKDISNHICKRLIDELNIS